MTNALFFATGAELSALRPDGLFTLSGPEGRHAVEVKRLQPGEPVDVADGAGRRVSGLVTAVADSELTLRIDSVSVDPPADPQLVLVQALAKGGRDELAVEAATELGIDGIVPWQAERSIVRWKLDKAVKGQQKWATTVRTAAKQARRATVPDVRQVVDGRSLQALVQTSDLTLLLHEEAIESLGAALGRFGHRFIQDDERSDSSARPAPEQIRRVLLIVGPEGGISPKEVAQLSGAGAMAVRMGAHVLRSSTAGPAALAVINDRLGRWV